MLDILAKRAIDLGVQVRFETEVARLAQLPESDLIVACDGVNSRLRQHHADRFGTGVDVGRNKYIWLGTSTVFNPFTYAFVETDAGWIWFYGYGFSSEASTCVVECSPETWAGLGFDRLGIEDEHLAPGEDLRAVPAWTSADGPEAGWRQDAVAQLSDRHQPKVA